MSGAFEYLDRRILAGFRTVSVLGQSPADEIIASCAGAVLFPKRAGEWVVQSANDLPGHHLAFTKQPAVPAVGSQILQIDLRSKSPKFLSRRFALKLPRDPDPAKRDQANSLFRWQDIVMPLNIAAGIGGHAAMLAVTVRRSDDQRLVEGAVVRIRPAGGLPERVTLTNASGEALFVVPSVPLANSGGGANVTPDFDADVDTIVDPNLARFHTPEELIAAQQNARLRQSDFIDPDEVIIRLVASATTATGVKIASSQRRAVTIEWSPP